MFHGIQLSVENAETLLFSNKTALNNDFQSK